MHACMQLEAVLWWQNHFNITLSQLLEHRYHVMHIRLPNKHNIANHFCLQVFLSEQIFSSLSMSVCSSFYYCYFSRLDGGELKPHSGCRYRLELRSRFFLPVGLVHDTEYFPLQSLNRYLPVYVKRCVQFKYHTYHVNFRNVLPCYLICR